MKGFTLMELLIALAVVGVITVLALPSYQNHVQRTNRAVAKALLAEVLMRQEAHYADRKAYAAALTALGYAADTMYLDRAGRPAATAMAALYRVTLAAPEDAAACTSAGSASGIGYTVVATPLARQEGDRCGRLCLASDGHRGSSGGSAADCWRS